MRVLMLGGTGAMGSHLGIILAKSGYDVYSTTRSNLIRSDDVKFINGNAKDLIFLGSLLEEYWDVIIDFMVYSTMEFKGRIDSILKSTGQYVFLSSARVYALKDGKLREDSPRLIDSNINIEYLQTDEYALSKARQEDILYNANVSNWTIVRPYITFSESRLQLGVLEKEAWLYRAINNKEIVFSKDIYDKETTLTYGWDVAKGICSLVGNQATHGSAYHITNDKSVLWSDVLDVYTEVISAKINRKPKVILQDISSFKRWHKAHQQIDYDRLYNRKFDNSKISRFLDTSSFVDPLSGLKECLETFLDSPNFLRIDWRSEGIKDKQVKNVSPLNKIPGTKNKLRYILGNLEGK